MSEIKENPVQSCGEEHSLKLHWKLFNVTLGEVIYINEVANLWDSLAFSAPLSYVFVMCVS